jgi:hypothetical protein
METMNNYEDFVKKQNEMIMTNLKSKFLVKLSLLNNGSSNLNYDINLILERGESGEIKINNIVFFKDYNAFHSFQKMIISVNSVSVFFTNEEIKFYIIDKFCVQKIVNDWIITCTVSEQYM